MLLKRIKNTPWDVCVKNCYRCLPQAESCRRRSTLAAEIQGLENSLSTLPSRSKVVICGGGVVGAAVAYHLAQRGWGQHTVLMEKERIGGESPWHSAGLVGMFKPSLAQVKLAQSSVKLLMDLESQGLPTGWKQCGSLLLARTRDRMTVYRRMKAQSVSWDIPCELITPERCKELCPLLHVDDLLGGLWIPGDGVGNADQICKTLTKEAISKGVGVIENCQITNVMSYDGVVTGVDTTQGSIECQYFVNCAGFWARHVGQLSKPQVKVPLHPCEHYYLHTKHIENLDPMTPVVRDPDGHIYFREKNGSIMAGGFEPTAKPVYDDDLFHVRSQSDRYVPEDWDHFHILLQEMLYRIPSLSNAVLDRLCNSLEAFSPDCKWIIGQAPEMRNYLVAAGMKTVGISAAGGVGQATADMIVDGYTKYDMYEMDVSRFLGLHNNKKFLRDRVREVPGIHYEKPYPFSEFETGRNLRMSPIYPALRDAGAVFGQVMGYERPSWFQEASEEETDLSIAERDHLYGKFKIAGTKTFGKPHWFDFVAKEYEACREAIGISDYSSFTKIDLHSKGREVVDTLQRLCSNDVDVPIGSIIHTGMQNEQGGYENDCSLARLAENHYMMIAPTIQQTRCKVWIARHLPSNGSVSLSDVTSMYTAICIMGPFTRALLSELTDTELSPANFPFFTFKELDVGLANGIRAMNLTHTGELGYVLYIPNEFALHVYTRLMEAGQKYGMLHAGYYAMRALRVEKFFAFWGQDLDTMTTPLECGRTWRVKFDVVTSFVAQKKQQVLTKCSTFSLDNLPIPYSFRVTAEVSFLVQTDWSPWALLLCPNGLDRHSFDIVYKKGVNFIGRDALLKQKEEGVKRQYVQLLLTDHDHETDLWSWGGEPIYRDGKYCGQTTTTGYGFTFRKQVCLGFVQNIDEDGNTQRVTNDYILSGHYEIDIAGIRFAAKVNLHSPNLPTKYPDQEREAYKATRDVVTVHRSF